MLARTMKKTASLLLWLAAGGLAVVSPLSAQTTVRVTGDPVNLRAKNLLTSEVVTQAHYDDRLTAYEIGEEWVCVAAPTSAEAWIMKTYVQTPANTIGTKRVNVRAGPSINYNILCTLELGATVKPTGNVQGDWLQIEPPAEARVWIHRDYVEVLTNDAAVVAVAEPEPVPEAKKSARRKKPATDADSAAPAVVAKPAAETPAVLPTPVIAASVPEKDDAVRTIPVPAPADLKLVPLSGQGAMVEVRGELRAAPLINEAPTRYRVVQWQDNRWVILCHVYGQATKFRSLQNKQVRLEGRQYWIQGAAAPVLVPTQIQEITSESVAP